MRHLHPLLLVACCFLLAGCEDPLEQAARENPEAIAKAREQIEQEQQQRQQRDAERQAELGNDNKGIIGKTTAKVVDAQKALAENPGLVVLERKKLGDDPLTQGANAYVFVRSSVSTLGMQRAIQLYQAEHGKLPSYDDFMRIMQENRVEFTMLYAWQMYGYDAQAGEIVILEDKAEKARRYKEAGLELNE